MIPKGNVIGHIVADETKRLHHLRFLIQKQNIKSMQWEIFPQGQHLNAPMGETEVTLDKGKLQEYSYLNDPKTTIYRGGNSVNITNIYQPSTSGSDGQNNSDNSDCYHYWVLTGLGNSFDKYLNWTFWFNTKGYFNEHRIKIYNLTSQELWR